MKIKRTKNLPGLHFDGKYIAFDDNGFAEISDKQKGILKSNLVELVSKDKEVEVTKEVKEEPKKKTTKQSK